MVGMNRRVTGLNSPSEMRLEDLLMAAQGVEAMIK